MTVVIRVDASVIMGTGHVMRCLTLADTLRKSGEDVRFVCRSHNGHLISFIEDKGYHVYALPQGATGVTGAAEMHHSHPQWLGVSWQCDAEETSLVLKESKVAVTWLIVDHYSLDYRWHKLLRPYTKKIMVIDDLAERQLDCDLLLDQTYGRTVPEYRALVPEHCELLLGSWFALLRAEFGIRRKEAIHRRVKPGAVKRILVCMGGMDPDDITTVVLRGLEQVAWPVPVAVDVVLGDKAPYLDQVRRFATESSLAAQVLSQVTDMEMLMLKADLAVGAGGTTAWERCCLGLPTLVVTIAENQKQVVENLVAAGAIYSLGKASLLREEAVIKSIERILLKKNEYEAMIEKSLALTDGSGADRVAQKILLKDGDIYLRKAVWEDCDMVFQWQSTPGTRQYCRRPDPPILEEHQTWFRQVLVDGNRELLIVEIKGVPVGLLRLDLIKNKVDTFEISILIAPEWQGNAIGVRALTYLRKQRNDVVFQAEVLDANLASIKAFKRTGFERDCQGIFISNPAIINEEKK